MTQDLLLEATAAAFDKAPKLLTSAIRRAGHHNKVPHSRHLSVEFDGFTPKVSYPPEFKDEIEEFELGNHPKGISPTPVLRNFLTSIPETYMDDLVAAELEAMLWRLF
jgi:hypothetical protein